MKKVYSKPEVMFESFALSTSIAGCAFETNLPSLEASCGYVTTGGFGTITVFVSEPNCTYVPPNGEYGNICYHNPTAENGLFGS